MYLPVNVVIVAPAVNAANAALEDALVETSVNVDLAPACLDARLTAARTTASVERDACVAQEPQPNKDAPVDLTVSAAQAALTRN